MFGRNRDVMPPITDDLPEGVSLENGYYISRDSRGKTTSIISAEWSQTIADGLVQESIAAEREAEEQSNRGWFGRLFG